MPTLDMIQQAVCTAAAQYPVKRVELFGSFANGTADENSDVDFLVEFLENPTSLIHLCGFRETLSELLNLDVDIVKLPRKANDGLVIGRTVNMYGAWGTERKDLFKILDEIADIETFTAGHSMSDVLTDRMCQKTIVMSLINIGELCKSFIFEQPYDGSMAQYGAAHAIDCYYLFCTFDGNDAAGTKEEVDLSRRFQHMIANFCVAGNPSTEDLEWPVYTAEDRCTMMIGQNMRVEKDPEAARVEAALKMIDLHEDFRYLKSFSSVFPVVQERYPEVFEAYFMNTLKTE